MKWRDISEEKFLEYQPRKGSYQIKNIYLTLNKIQKNSQIDRNAIKNQIRHENKEKSKNYNILKQNKYTLKSSKFVDSELLKGKRPLL